MFEENAHVVLISTCLNGGTTTYIDYNGLDHFVHLYLLIKLSGLDVIPVLAGMGLLQTLALLIIYSPQDVPKVIQT